jgi:hypothetical protein
MLLTDMAASVWKNGAWWANALPKGSSKHYAQAKE